MTHTTAYLPVPLSAWEYIAAALEQAGYPGHLITHFEGKNTVAIPLDGIAIIPVGDQDMFINSGRLSDLLVAAGEHAFRSGFEAGMAFALDENGNAGNSNKAWDAYEVPEDIHELVNQL
jgi:hypothetical protein